MSQKNDDMKMCCTAQDVHALLVEVGTKLRIPSLHSAWFRVAAIQLNVSFKST